MHKGLSMRQFWLKTLIFLIRSMVSLKFTSVIKLII